MHQTCPLFSVKFLTPATFNNAAVAKYLHSWMELNFPPLLELLGRCRVFRSCWIGARMTAVRQT
jgi:hypothetical protein